MSSPHSHPGSVRSRRDLCPGVLRPWPADDGGLVRLRLVGGHVSATSLSELSHVAATYGDGLVRTTARANLQLRAMPLVDGDLPPAVVDAIEATGLLPSRSHELVRNVMVSPLSGLRGGRADLRPVASALDELLLADPALGGLPGRFLFVLDDGRGDLVDRPLDLGLVALDAHTAQLRIGSDGWGEVVPLDTAAARLAALAATFQATRGTGPDAPWHVDELPSPLAPLHPRDPLTVVSGEPLPHGGAHVEAPDGTLDPDLVAALCARGADLIVTPWHGVLVPEELVR